VAAVPLLLTALVYLRLQIKAHWEKAPAEDVYGLERTAACWEASIRPSEAGDDVEQHDTSLTTGPLLDRRLGW
jgi:hypothetical protein